MSPGKNLRLCVLVALPVACSGAAEIERSTDNVSLSVERLSTRIWTLSLFCHTVDVHELAPLPRHVLHLGRAHISLSMLGSLLDLRLELDSFELSDMYLSLLRETNGTLRAFHRDMPQDDLNVIFSNDEKEEAHDTAAQSSFDLPRAVIDDLTITCDDHDSRARLWSLDNLQAELRNWRNPPHQNRDTWTLALSAGLYTNPSSRIEFASAVRSLVANPYLHATLTATHVRVATVDEIMDSASATHGDAEAETPVVSPATPAAADTHADPPSWFERCFSNEWRRLQTAIDLHLDQIASNATVQSFFEDREINAMSFDLLCSVTISNRTILPGGLSFRFHRPPPDARTLVLDYAITNTSQVIVPIDTPHLK